MDMRLGEDAALEVAAHVHFEAEAPPGVDELDREEGLVGLTAHERVLVTETPSSIVAVMSVGGDATLHELAVGRLDVAKEAVCAAEQRPRLDVARCGEESPHPPLQTIVERGRIDRFGQ